MTWPAQPPPWGPVAAPGAPAAPVGLTPGWPPPPPPHKAKLTWLWVLLGILVFLFAAAIVSIVAFVNAVRPPVDALNEILGAVDRGDYTAADDLMCRDERSSTSHEDFPAVIAPFANSLSEYDAYSFDPFGDERSVEYRVTDFDGDETTYRATMIHEDGEWRVCDFFR
jgi:hypothetical protein